MKIKLTPKILAKISQNIVMLTTLLIIFSAIIYYLYALNFSGIFLSLFLSIISLIILKKYHALPIEKEEIDWSFLTRNNPLTARISIQARLNIAIYLIFLAAASLELILSRSDGAFISPWEKINGIFFFFYFLSSLTLLLIIFNKKIKEKIKLLLISGHYLLSISIAVIIYKIGYGFDPFIHQAALEIIDKAGFIMPKTPYYLGYYGLTISLHKLFGISIYFLNKFLVPLIAAWLLPNLIYKLFRNFNKTDEESNISSLIGTLFILIFSLPLFIVSTPQNLSYIFIIAAVINSLISKNPTKAVIFSVAAAAIHPISGIPAIIWSTWLIFKHYSSPLNKKINKIATAIIIFSSALLLPWALFITSGGKINNLSFNSKIIINQIKEIFILSPAGSENWLLNLIYFISHNNKLLIFILITTGLILFYKNLQKYLTADKTYIWRGFLIMGISLIIAFILSGQITFKELIIYEQAGYAKRIITIAVIFLMPFAAIAGQELIKKIINLPERNIRFIWLILGTIFITASLYLAYPRFDKYFNSRGYSTSRFDLEAVYKIDSQATKNYIVLANQQVSAAALQALGFDHYYTNSEESIYFYPIPTGGTLYQYYLNMVYKNPNRQTMLEAMNLVGVDEAYLVINKYWNESKKIIQAAKITANSWETIGGKEIFIFKYKR